jgi:hypothetical protein
MVMKTMSVTESTLPEINLKSLERIIKCAVIRRAKAGLCQNRKMLEETPHFRIYDRWTYFHSGRGEVENSSEIMQDEWQQVHQKCKKWLPQLKEMLRMYLQMYIVTVTEELEFWEQDEQRRLWSECKEASWCTSPITMFAHDSEGQGVPQDEEVSIEDCGHENVLDGDETGLGDITDNWVCIRGNVDEEKERDTDSDSTFSLTDIGSDELSDYNK